MDEEHITHNPIEFLMEVMQLAGCVLVLCLIAGIAKTAYDSLDQWLKRRRARWAKERGE